MTSFPLLNAYVSSWAGPTKQLLITTKRKESLEFSIVWKKIIILTIKEPATYAKLPSCLIREFIFTFDAWFT